MGKRREPRGDPQISITAETIEKFLREAAREATIPASERRFSIGVSMAPTVVEAIDQARGYESRSAWILEAVIRRLREDEKKNEGGTDNACGNNR